MGGEKKQRHMVTNLDRSVTMALEIPIKDGDKTIDEVTIQRPKAKNLKNLTGEGSESEKSVHLIVSLTGLLKKQVDELDVYDFTAISEIIGEMTEGKFLQTGES